MNVLGFPEIDLGDGVIALNDLDFDYDALRAEQFSLDNLESGPPTPCENCEGEWESGGGGASGGAYEYPSNVLWLSISNDASFSHLTLHNTEIGYFYQWLGRTNLVTEHPNWMLGEIVNHRLDSSTQFDFTPVPVADRVMRFFWAKGASNLVSISAGSNALEPTNSSGAGGANGSFIVQRDGPESEPLTVYFRVSGTARNGEDYTSIADSNGIGSVTICGGIECDSAIITIAPLWDEFDEFDEPLTITLLTSNNDYVIDPASSSATILVRDNFPTNIFTVVATNLDAPTGIDYHPTQQALVISYNPSWNNSFPTNNFALITTNGVVTNWSGIVGVQDEVKLVTVKTNVAGFTNGDMYFGSATGIGWLSADGSNSNLNWCILTNETVANALLLRGSLCVDQTGIFSNQIIAVTSGGGPSGDPKGVWRVDAQGHPTLLTSVDTLHLEGVTALPSMSSYGPWAGHVVTGDEDKLPPLIYAIDSNGFASTWDSTIVIPGGVFPEDFDIIPPNQNLYACDSAGKAVVKLSASLLTNYVGDLLVTDAGEVIPPSRLFIVHWDAAGDRFVSRVISYKRQDGSNGSFEHVTFAPINVPNK